MDKSDARAAGRREAVGDMVEYNSPRKAPLAEEDDIEPTKVRVNQRATRSPQITFSVRLSYNSKISVRAFALVT